MGQNKRNWKIRDDETIFEMMRMHNNLSGMFQPLHDEMTRNYNMTVSSMMWKPEWKAILEAQGRPANAYNLMRPVINVIAAVEMANRKKVIAKPKSGGDAKLAETITSVLLHFLHRTNFDWHRTRVFLDAIIAKYGVYHIGWNYENDPLGELDLTAIDPRRIMYEVNYADSSWSKASFLFDKHELSLEEILNKFALNDSELQSEIIKEADAFFYSDPGKKDKWVSKRLKALFSAVYEVTMGGDQSTQGGLLNSKFLNWFNPTTGKFDVLELHEKRMEKRMLIFDPNRNRNIDITERVKHEKYEGIFDNEKVSRIKEEYKLDGEPRTNLLNKKFVTAVVPAFQLKVNEQPYPWNIKNYVYVPNYAYDTHADLLRSQSVIDDLIDPQSDYNKARSTKLELLQRYVNKGWIMDENAIVGVEEDWESNSMAPYRRVRSGYMNMIKPEESQTISADLIRETGDAATLIEQISNAGPSIRGKSESNVTSGKHFQKKEEAEAKSFSYLFNNVDHSTKTAAEVSLGIIQAMVTTERIFRITEDVPKDQPQEVKVNQAQFLLTPGGEIAKQIVNDITVGEYDIEIDTAPVTGNAREMEFAKMGELFNATAEINPKRADALLPILVKVGDFPYQDDILEAWQKVDGAGPGDQQAQAQAAQLQQMAMQMQMIMAKLGIAEKQEEVKGKKLENLKKEQDIKRSQMEMKQARVQNVLDMYYPEGGGSNGRGNKKPSYQNN